MTQPFTATHLNVNANSIGNSPGISSTESICATIFIVPNTGTHALHVIEIQVSPNGGNNWITIDTITGVGVKMVSAVADEWRIGVSVIEGSASTIDAYIIGL